MFEETFLYDELRREFQALHAKIDFIHQQVSALERKVVALASSGDVAAGIKCLEDLIRAGRAG